QWVERATAYRQHVSHQHLAALEVDRAKQARLWRTRTNLFREQQWESLQRMLLMHLEAGQRLLNKPDQEITFSQFARFQDTICRLARFVALNPVNEDPASFGAHITNQMEEDFQTAYGEPFDPEKYAHLRVVPNSPSPTPAAAAADSSAIVLLTTAEPSAPESPATPIQHPASNNQHPDSHPDGTLSPTPVGTCRDLSRNAFDPLPPVSSSPDETSPSSHSQLSTQELSTPMAALSPTP